MNRRSGSTSDLSARILIALRKRRPLRSFLARLGSEAESAGGALWLVGGFPRDVLEGSRTFDIDLLVTGVGFTRLGRILRRLPAADLGIRRVVQAGTRFPVYRIFTEWAGGPIDASPSRSPTSGGRRIGRSSPAREEAEACEDASRRDFTMNAILFRLQPGTGGLDGRLFDPFDGIGDLRRRRIRAVGNPADRFREDPIRILRAIRLKNEREGFSIERSTRAALQHGSNLLRACPGERVYSELRRSLSADPSRTLSDLHRTGVLAELIPEVADRGSAPLRRMKRRFRILETFTRERPLPELLANAVLLAEIAEREAPPRTPEKMAAAPGNHRRGIRLPATEAAARRLHMPEPRRLVRLIADLHRLDRLGNSPTPEARAEAILARQPDRGLLIALHGAVGPGTGRRITDLGAFLRKATRRRALLSGADLVAAGVPEGPDVEEVLLGIREATLAGTITTRAEALRLVSRHRAAGAGAPPTGCATRKEG